MSNVDNVAKHVANGLCSRDVGEWGSHVLCRRKIKNPETNLCALHDGARKRVETLAAKRKERAQAESLRNAASVEKRTEAIRTATGLANLTQLASFRGGISHAYPNGFVMLTHADAEKLLRAFEYLNASDDLRCEIQALIEIANKHDE